MADPPVPFDPSQYANWEAAGGADLIVPGGPPSEIVNAVDPDIVNAVWPELPLQQAQLSPPGNGMDRFTGRLLQGWDHVEQSLELIFATPYHSRVLRRWVGSFVPAILGDNATERVITRFFWAIATAIDLNEPRYRMKRIYVMGYALTNMVPGGSTAQRLTVGGINPETGQPEQNPEQPFAFLSRGAVEAMTRAGDFVFRQEGIYYPAGHLGNFTPYQQKGYGLISRGGSQWDVVSVGGG